MIPITENLVSAKSKPESPSLSGALPVTGKTSELSIQAPIAAATGASWANSALHVLFRIFFFCLINKRKPKEQLTQSLFGYREILHTSETMGFTFLDQGLRVESEERKVVGGGGCGKRGGLRSRRVDEENEVIVRRVRARQACNERRESAREGFWVWSFRALALWER
jgi:hypothetical protein